jgi:hypothetical protein
VIWVLGQKWFYEVQFFKSRVTFKLRGQNELRWEFELLSIKTTIEGYLWDCNAAHYCFKTLNGRLNVVLG